MKTGIKNNVRYWQTANGREAILCCDSTICYPLHNHISVYVAGLLLAGSLRIGWQEENQYATRLLRPGELFVIPPYLPHSIYADAPYTLLSVCLPAGRQTACKQGLSDEMEQVRQWLEDEPEQNCSLAELAAKAGFSKYHFVRLFKRSFGLTPHQFRLQRRVRKAQRLLRQGASSTEAALTAGFCDQSHFIKHFEKQLGLAPCAYQAACGLSEGGHKFGRQV